MTSPMAIYFEVAVAAPISQPLSYLAPAGVGPLPPGHRLLVPLGRRQVTGYLLSCSSTPPVFSDCGPAEPPPGPSPGVTEHRLQPGPSSRPPTPANQRGPDRGRTPTKAKAKLKIVSAVLDPEPLFPAALVPFFRWIADYYQHPIGEVIQSALPAGTSRRTVRAIELTPAGAQALANLPPGPEPPPAWLAPLLARGRLSPAQSAPLLHRPREPFSGWQNRGWLQVSTSLNRETIRAKTETVIMLTPAGNLAKTAPIPAPGTNLPGNSPDSCPDNSPDNYLDNSPNNQTSSSPALGPLKPSEGKTLAILHHLTGTNPGGVPAQQPPKACPGEVPKRELLKAYPGAGRALPGLLARNLISTSQRRLYRDPFGDPPPFFAAPEQLTAEQQQVLTELLPAVNSRRYAPFLLHGITGSGKTEIYLQAAAAALKLGRQVLVLVPEIALATQLEGHFCSRFGNAVALLHSGLSGGQRFDQWSLLLQGEAKIAIGARSALFAPLADPGLIIVDEEHDSAYKQEDGLRYNARDLALLRGLQQKATVILGSATPAVTSYHAALKGKFKLLELTKRVEDRALPEVEIIDLKEVKTISGFPPLFSPQLLQALKDNLAAGRQSLVFLNRRGFANLIICKDCGRPVQCEHCRVSLTYHKKVGALICHHCGYRRPRNIVCPHCRSGSLVPAGFGTERLEDELRRHFPQARLSRLDQDTTGDRKEFLTVLKAIRDHQVDIVIGTQMITKGHHFPQVTLVGVVWADAGLGIPDFKAAERTFQLLTQVTGRAGRGEHPGRVIIQTLQAEHYSVALARAHDYRSLYQQEIALRQRLNFPPFGRLINLRVDGEQEERVRELAVNLGQIATKLADGQTKVLGPAPAPLSRLKGRFRWQLLLKGSAVEPLHRLCRAAVSEFSRLAGASTVKLSLDVDPENML